MKDFSVNAVYHKSQSYYYHFGIQERTASMFGNKPEEIVPLKMRVSEDQTRPGRGLPDNDYWGWFDNRNQKFSDTLIFNKLFLLEMCFPDMETSERNGSGKAYKLEIVECV